MGDSSLESLRERDAVTLLVIGSFFSLLAVLVALGSFWAETADFTVAVNLGASGVLLVIGVVMVLTSRRFRRRLAAGREGQESRP